MKLAGGGPKFARFAKSGDKISNLATLSLSLSPDCENVIVSRGNMPVVVPSSAAAKYMDNFPNCELEPRLTYHSLLKR